MARLSSAALQNMNKAVNAQALNTAKFFTMIYQDPKMVSDAQMRRQRSCCYSWNLSCK